MTDQSESFEVHENLRFDVREGEFVTLLGPSGCGKTTLLRIVAGLDIDYQGEDQVYLMINVCKGCEYEDCLQCDPELEMDINREACQLCNKYKASMCEDCEQSEYIEITQDPDTEPEYRTIYGVNEYADLTTDTRPQPYNKQLANAWKQSPEKGIAALTLHTIQTNPKLLKAYSPELIEKHKQTLRE